MTIVPVGAASWTTTGPVSLTCSEYAYVPAPGKKSPPKYYFDYSMTATTTSDFNFQIDWTK